MRLSRSFSERPPYSEGSRRSSTSRLTPLRTATCIRDTITGPAGPTDIIPGDDGADQARSGADAARDRGGTAPDRADGRAGGRLRERRPGRARRGDLERVA